jgi:hypothetical protein
MAETTMMNLGRMGWETCRYRDSAKLSSPVPQKAQFTFPEPLGNLSSN